MGRIHRYGQSHDPVVVINLVAGSTREGRVLRTLLDKLETIRRQLHSDKVFDVIGRLFEGISIKDYLEQALADEGSDAVLARLEGTLTEGQVRAIQDRERVLFGNQAATSSGSWSILTTRWTRKVTGGCFPATFAALSRRRRRCWTFG